MKKFVAWILTVLLLNSEAMAQDGPPVATGTILMRNAWTSSVQFELVLSGCPSSTCPKQTSATRCLKPGEEASFPAATFAWKLIDRNKPDQGLQFVINSRACGSTPALASPYSGQFRYNPYYQDYKLFCKASGLGQNDPPISCVFEK